jgi:hypothetical protein
VASQGTNLGIPRVEVEGLPIGDRIQFGAPREKAPGIFAQNTFEFSDTSRRPEGTMVSSLVACFEKSRTTVIFRRACAVLIIL